MNPISITHRDTVSIDLDDDVTHPDVVYCCSCCLLQVFLVQIYTGHYAAAVIFLTGVKHHSVTNNQYPDTYDSLTSMSFSPLTPFLNCLGKADTIRPVKCLNYPDFCAEMNYMYILSLHKVPNQHQSRANMFFTILFVCKSDITIFEP